MCSLKYSINILAIIEMQDTPTLPTNVTEEMYNLAVYGCEKVTDYACEDGATANPFALFPRTDIDPPLYYRDLMLLLAIFVGFRLLSCAILSARANSDS